MPPKTAEHAVANVATEMTIAFAADDGAVPNSDGKPVCVFLTVMNEKVEVVNACVVVMSTPC